MATKKQASKQPAKPAKATKQKTKARGRPSKYKAEYAEQAQKLSLLGATDIEIADFFGVNEATLNRWKKTHKDFCVSIKRGKIMADAEIAEKLYYRASGYSCAEDKIFNNQGVPLVVPTKKQYPPDTTAAIFWLKNRQPERWRDKQEVQLEVTEVISERLKKARNKNVDK